MKNYLKWIGGREFITHLMEAFMIEYHKSNDLRAVNLPLSVCLIGVDFSIKLEG